MSISCKPYLSHFSRGNDTITYRSPDIVKIPQNKVFLHVGKTRNFFPHPNAL